MTKFEQALQLKHLTIYDAVQYLHVSTPTIRDWITGKHFPNQKNVRLLGELLGMSELQVRSLFSQNDIKPSRKTAWHEIIPGRCVFGANVSVMLNNDGSVNYILITAEKANNHE